jgi:hypothetical protein
MEDGTLNAVICCVGENRSDYFMKLQNLFLSIDKFGGEVNRFGKVVFFMEDPKEEYKRKLHKMDVSIISSTPINPRYPHNNKVRMLEMDLGYDYYVLLDHDTIVCKNFMNFLKKKEFRAKPVDWAGPSMEFWRKIFRRFNLELPSIRYTTTSDAKKIIPYFNSGVLLVPRGYRKKLYDEWTYYIQELISFKEKLNNYIFFIDQIALTLALQKANIQVNPLPIEMNFHIHIPVNSKLCPKKVDPYIIHYHNCINEFGNLTSCTYPGVQKRIEEFNKLLS